MPSTACPRPYIYRLGASLNRSNLTYIAVPRCHHTASRWIASSVNMVILVVETWSGNLLPRRGLYWVTHFPLWFVHTVVGDPLALFGLVVFALRLVCLVCPDGFEQKSCALDADIDIKGQQYTKAEWTRTRQSFPRSYLTLSFFWFLLSSLTFPRFFWGDSRIYCWWFVCFSLVPGPVRTDRTALRFPI
jgi:hypothetical protein